ncbi:putative DapA-like lyase [compost metagenome]
MKFEGIYTPAITPLTAEGKIDNAAFAEVLEALIEARVHGIIIGGSTGEYYAHTAQERLDLAALAREVIGTRVPLVVGTGAVRTEDGYRPAVVSGAGRHRAAASGLRRRHGGRHLRRADGGRRRGPGQQAVQGRDLRPHPFGHDFPERRRSHRAGE